MASPGDRARTAPAPRPISAPGSVPVAAPAASSPAASPARTASGEPVSAGSTRSHLYIEDCREAGDPIPTEAGKKLWKWGPPRTPVQSLRFSPTPRPGRHPALWDVLL